MTDKTRTAGPIEALLLALKWERLTTGPLDGPRPLGQDQIELSEPENVIARAIDALNKRLEAVECLAAETSERLGDALGN